MTERSSRCTTDGLVGGEGRTSARSWLRRRRPKRTTMAGRRGRQRCRCGA